MTYSGRGCILIHHSATVTLNSPGRHVVICLLSQTVWARSDMSPRRYALLVTVKPINFTTCMTTPNKRLVKSESLDTLTNPSVLAPPVGCCRLGCEEGMLQCFTCTNPLVRVQREALLQQVNKVIEMPRLSVVHPCRCSI